jgi:phospholipid transport system substrate-binding protein
MLLFAGALSAAELPAAEILAPDVLARRVTDEVLAIVRADKDIQAGNQRKVHELVDAEVVPHFNFVRMTRLAMGRNWRDASADQQQRLVEEFRALLVRTYTSAFQQYRNQTVEYRRPRMGAGDTEVVVQSLIRQPSGQPVAVDYSMEKTEAGWKVYNVKIEGVSMVENYRNTFNTEVQRSGVEGLIRSLAEKNRQLVQQAQSR